MWPFQVALDVCTSSIQVAVEPIERSSQDFASATVITSTSDR